MPAAASRRSTCRRVSGSRCRVSDTTTSATRSLNSPALSWLQVSGSSNHNARAISNRRRHYRRDATREGYLFGDAATDRIRMHIRSQLLGDL
jgi:hypothetical protein